jgi:hypothetical protein
VQAALETRHIDVDALGVERHLVAALIEHGRGGRGQLRANRRERLAKAVPGTVVRDVAPEERGELLARATNAGTAREVREERERLAARDAQLGAIRQPHVDAAEKRDANACHVPGRGSLASRDRPPSMSALFTLSAPPRQRASRASAR